MSSNIVRIESKKLNGTINEDRARKAIKIAYPNSYIYDLVEVPGRYQVYAGGTDGDVTIMCWIKNDGDCVCKWVCW